MFVHRPPRKQHWINTYWLSGVIDPVGVDKGILTRTLENNIESEQGSCIFDELKQRKVVWLFICIIVFIGN